MECSMCKIANYLIKYEEDKKICEYFCGSWPGLYWICVLQLMKIWLSIQKYKIDDDSIECNNTNSF